MNRDLAELLVALALIVASAWFAVATAQPAKRERPEKAKRLRSPAPFEVSGAAPPAALAVAEGATAVLPAAARSAAEAFGARQASGVSTRPRIFTGESALPTHAKPAGKRALKLVAGMTALAAAGAVGLLALVGAIIKMFQRIGG